MTQVRYWTIQRKIIGQAFLNLRERQMAQQIGMAAQQAVEAISRGQSQRVSTSSTDHRRKFLETFQRWEILFKRKDGRSVEAEKWLIAEYYDSLKFLSEEGLDVLTKRLKEECTFFPTVKECLDMTKAGQYDFGHPFYDKPARLFRPADPVRAIGTDERHRIEDRSGDR